MCYDSDRFTSLSLTTFMDTFLGWIDKCSDDGIEFDFTLYIFSQVLI